MAGGFGKRLQSVIKDIPKPMAPVQGKPFLEYLFMFLENQGISSVILSVCYLNKKIMTHFGSKFNNINIIYSVESEPLGTGGAAELAMEKINGSEVFILNGDTLFNIDLYDFYRFHQKNRSACSIALKETLSANRYGGVIIDSNSRVTGFAEKRTNNDTTWINGGIYLIQKGVLKTKNFSGAFSIEKDYFEKHCQQDMIYGYISQGYFVDIGIPDDYQRAQNEIGNVVVKGHA